MRQAIRAHRLTVAALGALALLPTAITRGEELAKAEPVQPDTQLPLSSALDLVCREAGLQIVYSSYLTKGMTSKRATPGKPVEESLRELLAGTGLTYEFVNDHTVTIVKMPPPAAEEKTSHDESPQMEGPPPPSRSSWRLSDLGEPIMTQVVVTGTHLTGVAPVGAQLITISRQEINRSGYATVQDVIRALPQNFNGGASEDYRGSGQEGLLNLSLATGVNLRGLGSGSTLVLLNGRRLAPGAAEGRFVDISAIPLSAIEKIEVLPDGASAIYGADAVGGVVNFILRDDFEGAESLVRVGSGTGSGPAESQIAQTLGSSWRGGSGLISFEFYDRDALPAADRAQSAVSDLRPFGGDNFDVREGSPGTITDGINTWAIPYGQDGTSLSASDFVAGTINWHNRNEGRDILPEHERLSLVGRVKHALNDRLDLFGDLLLSERDTTMRNPAVRMTLRVPETNAFYVHPAGGSGPLFVHYSFYDDFGPHKDIGKIKTYSAAGGAAARLGNTWSVTGTGTYASYSDRINSGPYVNPIALDAALSDSNRATAFNPFGDGSATNPATLASIIEYRPGRRSLDMWGGNIAAEGTWFNLRDREVKLALGVDYMRQSLSSFIAGSQIIPDNHELSRDITATYVEVMIPFVNETNRRTGVEHAQLSIAGRHEHYSDTGSAISPRIGFTWSPANNVSLRGTWSKSFKAPNLMDLDETANGSRLDIQADPNSLSGSSPVLLWFGGNRDLHDENSSTWTLGAEIKPRPSTSIELTYFNIDFRDRVERVDYTTSFLSNPLYVDVVNRNPTPEQRAAVCTQSIFLGTLDQCLNAPVVALVDMRLGNIAKMKTSGIDLLGKVRVDSRIGTFDFGLNGTYLLNYSQARFRTSPLLNLLDTTNNPIDLRLRGSVAWRYGQFGLSTFLNYSDDYDDVVSRPSRKVGSWTTLDFQASYATRMPGNDFLNNTSLSLSVHNLFNKNPPFVNNSTGIGYDAANADLMGRFISLRIRKDW